MPFGRLRSGIIRGCFMRCVYFPDGWRTLCSLNRGPEESVLCVRQALMSSCLRYPACRFTGSSSALVHPSRPSPSDVRSAASAPAVFRCYPPIPAPGEYHDHVDLTEYANDHGSRAACLSCRSARWRAMEERFVHRAGGLSARSVRARKCPLITASAIDQAPVRVCCAVSLHTRGFQPGRLHHSVNALSFDIILTFSRIPYKAFCSLSRSWPGERQIEPVRKHGTDGG